MHLNSELIFREYALSHFSDDMKVLEIGPSGNPSHYCRLVNRPAVEWHTLDISTKFIQGAETAGRHTRSENPYRYPIEDSAFDLVLAGQVAEHVPEIWTWLKELKRITRQGGKIILITPVSWPFHEAPVDCWRIYPDGMKALCRQAGLNILLCKLESIEAKLFPENMTIPGASTVPLHGRTGKMHRLQILYNHLIRNIPIIRRMQIPFQVAWDVITIVGKPSHPSVTEGDSAGRVEKI